MLTRFLIADIPFAPRAHGGRAARDPSKGLSDEAHHYYFTSRAQGSAKINADRPHKLWKFAGWEAAKRSAKINAEQTTQALEICRLGRGQSAARPRSRCKAFQLVRTYSIELQL